VAFSQFDTINNESSKVYKASHHRTNEGAFNRNIFRRVFTSLLLSDTAFQGFGRLLVSVQMLTALRRLHTIAQMNGTATVTHLTGLLPV